MDQRAQNKVYDALERAHMTETHQRCVNKGTKDKDLINNLLERNNYAIVNKKGQMSSLTRESEALQR